MASSTDSLASSKHGVPCRIVSRSVQDKKWPIVDDYRYLAAGLLKHQMPQLIKSASQQATDGEMVCVNRTEQNRSDKKGNRGKANMEINTMRNLAREMGRMLTNAKSKSHTNELLQLFKNTLNNFVVEKHQMTTGAGFSEGTELNVNKSIKKKRLTQRKVDDEKGVAQDTPPAPPSTPTPSSMAAIMSSMKHQKTKKPIVSERETSVITTTTMTRCKIKEPIISVIESSKTNVLHRCYAKQNVKVLPHGYKNKKSNGSGCQRPNIMKPSRINTNLKQKTSSTNQQMKTIYENEQFDKTNKASTLDNVVVQVTSSSSTELLAPKESNSVEAKQSQHDSLDREVTTVETAPTEEDNDAKPLDVSVSEPDNSLVHRLTSFWNKKLKEGETEKSVSGSSEQSSITSSVTSISVTNSNNNLGLQETASGGPDKDLKPCANVRTSTVQIKGGGDGKDADESDAVAVKEDTELPEIKMGLMDELITVLQNRKSSSQTVGNATNNNKPSSSNKYKPEWCSDNDETGGVISDSVYCVKASLNTDSSSDGHNCDQSEGDEADYSSANDQVSESEEECTEETIEAIHTCLMSKITVHSQNDDFSDSKTYDVDDDTDTMVTEESSRLSCEVDDKTEKDQESDDKYVLQTSRVDYSGSNESIDDNKTVDRTDYSAESLKNITTDSSNRIAATITNVSDIIVNLRNLIFEIEAIPDELKSVNCMNIPDKIEESLSIIAENDSNCNVHGDPKHIEKEILIGKKEGRSKIWYIPSTFTIPIIENVINPIEMILFPRRQDYLTTRRKMKRQIAHDKPKPFDFESKTKDSTNFRMVKDDAGSAASITYVTQIMTKTHSTIFYMTSKPNNGISTETSPSVVFLKAHKIVPICPPKSLVTIKPHEIQTINSRPATGEESPEPGCGGTHGYTTVNRPSNDEHPITDEVENRDSINANQEPNNRSCNLRRRRFWLQTNADEDSVLMGGDGDYSGGTIAIPAACHRTSSMSVLVSGSLNDSNSQTDINTIDPSLEPDANSRNVIHELNEEQDCADMTSDGVHTAESSETNGEHNINMHQQSTSTTELCDCVKKVSVRDVAIMTNSSELSLSIAEPDKSDGQVSGTGDKAYNRDYIVLCCNTQMPKHMDRAFERKSTDKYNLNTVFKDNPILKQELCGMIDIENLCEKERKLIAICLMLLRRNMLIEKSLLDILLETTCQQLAILWNKAKRKVVCKIYKAKRKLVTTCQSQGDYVLCCQYRNLIKIIYTMLISLTLCFIIQKNFCGFSLPVRFPW